MTIAVVHCRNAQGKLAPIPQDYFEVPVHYVKKIQGCPEGITFHAIILVGRSLHFWNKRGLTGQAKLQIRQTEKLGYKTKLVMRTFDNRLY